MPTEARCGADTPLPSEFPTGLEVLAFYHSNLNVGGHRSVHLCSSSCHLQPLAGLSSGWLPATVLQSRLPEDDSVLLRFAGPFGDSLYGMKDFADLKIPVALVRPKLHELTRPLLSVLIVRWWDYRVNSTWSDFAVTNDGMLLDLVDGQHGMMTSIPGEFEIYTLFITDSKDLRVKGREHWAQAVLKGVNTVVWYFVWPCQRSNADTFAGCVNERDFFAFQQRMERVGLRSGWPHPSTLYRQLCGKLWVPQMSLHKEWCVPPTLRVQYVDIRRDAVAAARRAIESLSLISKTALAKPDCLDDFRGVVKLGFSWQGDDVLPFVGIHNLARVLRRLVDQPGGEQLNCLVALSKHGTIIYIPLHSSLNAWFVSQSSFLLPLGRWGF